jgi:hypothetical protein
MVACPKCGKEIVEADKKIENKFFSVALFTCEKCKTKFKVKT